MLLLGRLCTTEWYAGRWQRARDHSDAAVELAEQTPRHTRLDSSGVSGRSWRWIFALVEQARTSAREAIALVGAGSDHIVTIPALGVLGRLELLLGNLEAAGGYLRDLPERSLARGWADPTNPIWPDSIETLAALGELELARTYLEQLERHSKRIESPGAGQRSPLPRPARCQGGRSRRRLRGLPPLARGARRFGVSTGARPDAALSGGGAAAGAGEAPAREALEQALRIFEELGARLWADKARAELRRISGRAPASEELTETERRVAELAAQGRTDKEIAAGLYHGRQHSGGAPLPYLPQARRP